MEWVELPLAPKGDSTQNSEHSSRMTRLSAARRASAASEKARLGLLRGRGAAPPAAGAMFAVCLF